MVPIIDTLAHPTISGEWTARSKSFPATFDHLAQALSKNNYLKGFAIGMDGVENYNHREFIENCSSHSNLIPVAGFNPNADDLEAEVKLIKSMGYVGIKIHPRYSSMEYDSQKLGCIFRHAAQNQLAVWYCTYSHTPPPHYPEQDPFYVLAAALNKSTKTKVILVHGGDVSILRYAELARFNPNVLVDLSLTMMKYPGSSVEDDIRFLFAHFDQKLTLGTDYPEYSHSEVRDRFDYLGRNVSASKLDNIGYRNIATFLNLSI